MQELVNELNGIEQLVTDRLGDGSWLVRLKVLPAFADPMVIGVQRGRSPSVVWRSWCKQEDLNAFRSPVERMKHPRPFVPTLREVSAPADPQQVEALLRRFRVLQVPAYVPSEVAALDGVSFDLLIGGQMAESRFHWWGDHPAQWRPLMQHFSESWRALSQIFGREHEVPMPEFPWS